MESASGTVRSFRDDPEGRRAVVEVDVGAVCARCAAGSGCGAGLFGGAGRARQIEARIAPGLELSEGDTVRISLRPRELLRAASAVYGPPLVGAAAASAAAYALAATDVAAAAAALLGMVIGGSLSRLYLARAVCLSRFLPIVERRLASQSRGP